MSLQRIPGQRDNAKKALRVEQCGTHVPDKELTFRRQIATKLLRVSVRRLFDMLEEDKKVAHGGMHAEVVLND